MSFAEELLDRTKDYEDDPLESLVTEIFPVHLPLLQSARFKCEYGGRGSAKTRTFVAILLNNVQYYGWRLVCFREIMKSLDDSVYQEFVDEIYRTNRQQFFKIIKGQISCPISGGMIKFDGLFRNQQKLKGYAGFDAAWVEEAENVTAESWKFLIPTLRKNGSEIWVSYNPDDPLSATHLMFVTDRKFPDYTQELAADGKTKVFNEDGTPKMRRYCVVLKVNYTENPRFPEELRIDMELMKENDYELYLHVYEGEPVGNSDLAVIKPTWIAACIDAHKKPEWDLYGLPEKPVGGWLAGFDVADEGKDKNAFVWRHAWLVCGAEEWKDDDPNTAARHVFMNAFAMGMTSVTYDNIGVGAGAKGAIREEKEKLEANVKNRCPQYRGFTANASPLNPEREYMPGKKNEDMFVNLKAQAWWLLRDRFKNTYDALQGKPYDKEKLISLDGTMKNITKLAAELAQPRRDLMNGKVAIESKKDMKKRGVMSPNLADACVMAFAPETGFKIENLI